MPKDFDRKTINNIRALILECKMKATQKKSCVKEIRTKTYFKIAQQI